MPSARGQRASGSLCPIEAYRARGGWPKDEAVFAKTSGLVIRSSDLTFDDEESYDLQTGGCTSSLRNLCKATLAKDDVDLPNKLDAVHEGLCRVADVLGKDLCNKCEVLADLVQMRRRLTTRR